ncbi:hypothetical protein GHK86_02835 [Acidimicrobiaceae bacterium USS-CC1]|uniref:Transposase n=1 Tax=Acidiferrimicrobium australe TaxID=2664430 RepID=A0ABW9QPD1_9ACTN|nr:hypothetical protein [Acidiferrimicrobium australe]
MDPARNTVVAVIEIDASLAGYRRLWRWAGQFEERRWAVEGVRGLGRHLAQWLVARGEQVDDVASTATARVRELSRGGRRKNDVWVEPAHGSPSSWWPPTTAWWVGTTGLLGSPPPSAPPAPTAPPPAAGPASPGWPRCTPSPPRRT